MKVHDHSLESTDYTGSEIATLDNPLPCPHLEEQYPLQPREKS